MMLSRNRFADSALFSTLRRSAALNSRALIHGTRKFYWARPDSEKRPALVIHCKVESQFGSFSDPRGSHGSQLHGLVLWNVLTAAAAGMADPVMSIVDTAFVGRLGILQLAAMGPNAAIFNAVFYFMIFTGAVVTTDQVGVAFANQDQEGVRSSLLVSIIVCLCIGSMAAVSFQFLAQPLLRVMGTNTEMMAPAVKYFRIRSWSIPASLLLIVFGSAYRGIQDIQTPCLVIIASAVLNCLLDPVLIFSANWGIGGAAVATTASQWLGVAVFLVLVLKNKIFFAPSGDKRNHITDAWPSLDCCFNYVAEGIGLAFRATVIISIYSLASIVAVRLGTLQSAAFQLVEQLQSFQLTFIYSYLEVGQAMVVNAQGPKRNDEYSWRLSDCIVGWCAVSSFLLGMLTWHWRGALLHLFTPDALLLSTAESAVLPACAMLAMAWNNALEGVLLGLGDSHFVVTGFLPAASTGILILFYVMWKKLGVSYIVWALATYYLLLTTIFGLRYWFLRSRSRVQ